MNQKYEQPEVEVKEIETIDTAEIDSSLPGINLPDDEF